MSFMLFKTSPKLGYLVRFRALASLIVGCLGIGSAGFSASAASPRIFYSDLDSGPGSGGENGNGAYVTIYGTNFGSSQSGSSVKIGTTTALNFKFWTNNKVAFQIPTGTPAGSQPLSISVNGNVSNAVSFTVRGTGVIYCVSVTGSDSAVGTFSGGCWRTVQHAVTVMQPGDTVYVRQGIVETRATDVGSVSIGQDAPSTGTVGNPIAVVGYPGETAQIGGTGSGPCSTVSCVEGMITYNVGRLYSYFTVANLVLRGNNTAIGVSANYAVASPRSSNWRIVGNDISCPNGDGATACAETSQVDYVYLYGNNIHDTGWSGASTLYHGVYFSTDSNHIDAGWNTITHVNGGSGMQFHSTPLGSADANDPTGHQQFDLHVHDNTISDTQNSALLMATVDPSRGPVEVYNNVIYRGGRGPSTPGQGGFFCIDFPGYVNQQPAGGGTAEVFNNTLYDCGSETARQGMSPGWGGAIDNAGLFNGQPALIVRLRNNIIYQPTAGEYYWAIINTTADVSASSNIIQGSDNLIFGLAGAGPSNELNNPNVTRTIQANPVFLNISSFDFHIDSSSPAASGGTVVPVSQDHDGVPVPTANGYERGAYAVAGSPVQQNVTISVTPATATLLPGQTQLFSAAVVGTANTQVTWSLTGAGTITSNGLYTAPASISAQQQVTVTGVSAADPTKRATATITLTTTPSQPLTITPATVTLAPGQSQQFTANQSQVRFSLAPAVGTITSTGLYAAPATITTQQQVTVTATSLTDSTAATATIALTPPSQPLTITPAAVTLAPGQSQQFTTNKGQARFSLAPAVGTLTSTGLYTAPATITTQQQVTVTATSLTDSTTATATVTLRPATTTTISVTPASASLSAGQTQAFSAGISSGQAAAGIVWSISPTVGSISAQGVYTAPNSISVQQSVTVTAKLSIDLTKTASASITLVPTTTPPGPTGGGAASLSWSMASGRLVLNWVAPTGRKAGDSVVLTSTDAPDWWNVWQQPTNGTASGTSTVNLPTLPGRYEFRYIYAKDSVNGVAMGTSTPINVGVSGYQLTSSAKSVAPGGSLKVQWIAGLGARAGDFIALFRADKTNDQPIWSTANDTGGAATGAITIRVPGVVGNYELRYIFSDGMRLGAIVPIVVQ